MKSTAANDNRRVKQTMFTIPSVSLFRDKHYPNSSVRDALRIFYLFYFIS